MAAAPLLGPSWLLIPPWTTAWTCAVCMRYTRRDRRRRRPACARAPRRGWRASPGRPCPRCTRTAWRKTRGRGRRPGTCGDDDVVWCVWDASATGRLQLDRRERTTRSAAPRATAARLAKRWRRHAAGSGGGPSNHHTSASWMIPIPQLHMQPLLPALGLPEEEHKAQSCLTSTAACWPMPAPLPKLPAIAEHAWLPAAAGGCPVIAASLLKGTPADHCLVCTGALYVAARQSPRSA